MLTAADGHDGLICAERESLDLIVLDVMMPRRSGFGVLDRIGGWDEEALTEDSEMSLRIYAAGWYIKFVPYSVTWEQEPERFSVWVKQRTRWVRGNNYVIAKFLRHLPDYAQAIRGDRSVLLRGSGERQLIGYLEERFLA